MPSVDLLSPGRIDGFDTRNRMFMAPMTRSRAVPGGGCGHHGVSVFDPLVFMLASLSLIVATAAASYIPARRVLRIDPSEALRPK